MWQQSRTGLFYILIHESLQTWVPTRDLFCSCRRIHSNENYCIPLKTLSRAEEGCRFLGIERGKIIKSKSYLGLSESNKNIEDWIRESNMGKYTTRDSTGAVEEDTPIILYLILKISVCQGMFSDVCNISEQEYLRMIEFLELILYIFLYPSSWLNNFTGLSYSEQATCPALGLWVWPCWREAYTVLAWLGAHSSFAMSAGKWKICSLVSSFIPAISQLTIRYEAKWEESSSWNQPKLLTRKLSS